MSFEIIGTYAIGFCLLIGAGFAVVGTIGLLWWMSIKLQELEKL